jgi:hypothetical protein
MASAAAKRATFLSGGAGQRILWVMCGSKLQRLVALLGDEAMSTKLPVIQRRLRDDVLARQSASRAQPQMLGQE